MQLSSDSSSISIMRSKEKLFSMLLWILCALTNEVFSQEVEKQKPNENIAVSNRFLKISNR